MEVVTDKALKRAAEIIMKYVGPSKNTVEMIVDMALTPTQQNMSATIHRGYEIYLERQKQKGAA